MISSLSNFLNFAVAPFANYISEVYFSFRSVMMTGGLLASLGIFLSAFVPRMEYWIITYGILSGFGFGLVYSPCFTVVNFYFKRRRALAIGIVLLGTGIGSVLFPILYKFLIHTYGLRGAVIVISGLTLNLCVCAALIRQPQELTKKIALLHLRTKSDHIASQEEVAVLKESVHNQTDNHPKRPLFNFYLFHNASFVIYTLAFMCNIFAYLSNFVMIPGHARIQGMTNSDIAVFLSTIGGSMIFARPSIGWLADSKLVQKRKIIGTCAILGGIFSLVLPWIQGYRWMIVYSVSFGIFPSSFFMFIPLLLLEIVTLENLPQAQGLLYLCLSVSAGLSQPAAGWIKDLTGDWDASFHVSGAISILAGVLYMSEPILRKCNRKQKAHNANQSDETNGNQNL